MGLFKKKQKEPLEGVNPVVKKKGVFKQFIEKYNFLILKDDIESYGFEYSFKKFALASGLYLAATVGVALYIKLKLEYIILLIVATVLMIPFLIRSQFDQRYQLSRFDMLASYLDNVIPLFKRTPIITSAWAGVVDLLDGEMHDAVQEAYDMVVNNTDDPNVLQSAFAVIESHFPNSRIHSVHQMMYTIETKNTSNYVSAIDNLWLDTQQWITRVSNFHKDLSKRRTDLMILSLLTMFSNCLFTSMYSMTEVFEGFTENSVYQASSTIFMIILMVTMCIFQMKLTGVWLLDDKSLGVNKRAVKSFNYITDGLHDDSIKKQDKILAVIVAICDVIITIKLRNIPIAILLALVAYMIYTTNRRNYHSHQSNISKFLQVEFPTWMRDISINLQNLTVLNSIEQSKETSSTIMCYYINKFLDRVYENPSDIAPFNEFLAEFKIDGVRPVMKALFSMQSLSKDDMSKQVNDLVLRNQELLARAEQIKNDSAVGNLKLLGFVPVVVLVVQMLISMGLLFAFMLNFMAAASAI